jgi:FkbH-like protein
MKELLASDTGFIFINSSPYSLEIIKEIFMGGFLGLDSEVYYEVLQNNVDVLNTYRKKLTFEYNPINRYIWSYNADRNLYSVRHDSLHPSLQKDISNKYKNILEISDDLGLALDSFVFWHDNQIEREKVKKFLPEVKVIDAKDDVSFWANQLNQDLNLFKLNILKEDKNKQAQYIQRKKFINDKKNFKDEIEYLSKINLRAKVEEISDHNILRASQLTQKTNQFNFTSKRYTVEDILKFNQSSDKIIKVISLKDTYGDHGIVGLYILNIEKNKKAVVDTFLMSCRVIGRYLEDWMLKKIIDNAKKNNVKNLYIPFSLTLKNFICKNFFVRNNLIQKNINKFVFNQKEMEFNLNLNNKINIKLAKIYEKKNK